MYSDYKDDKLTREEYVKRSKAMVEQIDELHQEIEQLKTEIPPEDNSSSKFETQLESIINMESFDREKIQKVIKKVIINGEDNIEIVWNTDDPFFKQDGCLWSLECRENMALLSSAGISIAFNILR